MRCYLDKYVAMTSHRERFDAEAYRFTAAWKGAVFRRERLAKAAMQSPHQTVLFHELQEVAGQLVHQAWASPEPNQLTRWQESVERLSSEKERLEAAISRENSQYIKAARQVQWTPHC